jgi:hypothetical protein
MGFRFADGKGALAPCSNSDSRSAEVDPLVVELRDGLLMDHTVTL